MILFGGVYVKGKEWVVRIEWIGRTQLMHPKEERSLRILWEVDGWRWVLVFLRRSKLRDVKG